MSNKNSIAHVAAALSDMEGALEATRQTYAGVSTTGIEARMTAFSEVVRNTRWKMARPAGFEWALALQASFKVVGITDTSIKVESVNARGGDRATFDVPRADLSLSTWQVTGIIRRLSAERLLAELNTEVAEKKAAVTKIRKEVAAAQKRLQQSEHVLSGASDAVARRLARMRKVEAKRDAARARRKATTPEAVAAQ